MPLLILVALIFPIAANAQMRVWTDEQGVTHYESNRAPQPTAPPAPMKSAELPENASFFLDRRIHFRPDGKIYVTNEQRNLPEWDTWESGAYNRTQYKFYHRNAAGNFGRELADCSSLFLGMACDSTPTGIDSWKTSCRQDAMTDHRSCYAYKDDLMIFVFDDGSSAVVVGKDHRPNSRIALRFGKEPPLVESSTGWIASAANQIISRMKTSPKVLSRYQRLDGIDRDRETDLFAFAEVFEFLKFAVCQKGPCR